MNPHQALNHSTPDCKYHFVIILKCRRKMLYFQPILNLSVEF